MENKQTISQCHTLKYILSLENLMIEIQFWKHIVSLDDLMISIQAWKHILSLEDLLIVIQSGNMSKV